MALGKRFSWIRRQYGDHVAWFVLTVRRPIVDLSDALFDPMDLAHVSDLEAESKNPERARDEKHLWWLADQIKEIVPISSDLDRNIYYSRWDYLNVLWPDAIDWVLAEGIDLRGLSIADVERRTADWHAQHASVASDRDVSQGLVVQRFEDGWTVQRLSAEHMKDEGDAMGHCVGSGLYDEDLIYSLRDPNGRPHVTMEIGVGAADTAMRGTYVIQSKGKGNKRPVARYLPYVREFLLMEVGPNLSRWGEALPAAPERLVVERLRDGFELNFKINSWRARLTPEGYAEVLVGVGALTWADSNHDLFEAMFCYGAQGTEVLATRFFLFGDAAHRWDDAATVMYSFPFNPLAPGDALAKLYDTADAMEAAWQSRLAALHLEPGEPERDAIEEEIREAVELANRLATARA